MITPSSLGRASYEAYCATRDNKAWDGSPLPKWAAVKNDIKAGWIAGALAVAKELDAAFKCSLDTSYQLMWAEEGDLLYKGPSEWSIETSKRPARFWVSWLQPTTDHRPLGFPPHAPVLGWWCSGYDSDDTAILVALIEAKDEKNAEEVIKKEWPEWSAWRFINPVNFNFLPSDRFQIQDWMKSRIYPT